MARVLVAGGAGFVGSAACAWLLEAGHSVWVVDDLSTGHRELLLTEARGFLGFTHARVGDRDAIGRLLREERIDCAMHFAAYSLVGESVHRPEKYSENNVDQARAFVEILLDHGVERLIFSSTCAIFGDPQGKAIDEGLPCRPLNPYGETKLRFEEVLRELVRTRGLKAAALRYFNAAGAEAGLRVGEWHEPESHLIPRVLAAAADGVPVEIFGTDYPTADGTCVRDYIHVTDLAAGHGKALEKLLAAPDGRGVFHAWNLGSQNGYTVREVIAACERATGRKLEVLEKSRRAGDAPALIADASLAHRELGWSTRLGLEDIVSSAWAWEQKRRQIRRRAVFLDRDGTLNEDPGYLADPDQLRLLPGVGPALARLKAAGYVLVVVSNQSGIARGLIQPGDLPRIHERMEDLLRPFGASIDGYELCFHHPDEDCGCRKPKTKLLLDGAHRFNIDLARSFMVGDKRSDVRAGRNARVRGALLVRTGNGAQDERTLQAGEADFVCDSLAEAADWILSRD